MASPGPPAEGSVQEPGWAKRSAWLAIALLLIPYVLAFSVAVVERITRAEDALVDIERVQLDIHKRVGGELQNLTISTVVDAMVVDVYGEEKTRTPERARNAERYRELAAAAAHEWRAAYLEIEHADARAAAAGKPPAAGTVAGRAWQRARERAAETLRWEWVFVLCVQAFNVFLLPGLGILSFLRASREIVEANEEARKGFASFARAVRHRRNRFLLITKRRLYFWRRYALGALLTLGTTYMFAPRGQLASALGDYTVARPLPGGSSHPFFADHFIDAPIMVSGFVGYLLYVFVSSLHRSFSRNLTDRFTLSLLNRGLVVGLLGLVLSATTDAGDGARALVFIVGIFPQRGVEWLSKKASLAPEGLPGMTAKFEALPAIDEDKLTVLRELGIDGVHDLARCDLERLLDEVGIDPNLLCRAADRALLIDTFGLEGAKKLEALPAYTASELVLYVAMPHESFAEMRASLTADETRAQKLDIRTMKRRSPEERQQRMAIVAEKLGAVDVGVQLAALEDDDNVQFILHQTLAYAQR